MLVSIVLAAIVLQPEEKAGEGVATESEPAPTEPKRGPGEPAYSEAA